MSGKGEYVDFSSSELILENLDGAAQKLQVSYNGHPYILKFGEELEPDEKRPMQGSYNNSHISEWVACRVFSALGIPVQDTVAGTYNGRRVVGCRNFLADYDFTAKLLPFKTLENNIVSSSKRGRRPRLENLKFVFETHPALAEIQEDAWKRYWDTFVVDAVIGNFDRHGGNWGYIASAEQNKIVDLAPVYDCASSFHSRLSEGEMATLVDDYPKMLDRAKEFPKACLIADESKPPAYHDFLVSVNAEDARSSLFLLAEGIGRLDTADIAARYPGISATRVKYFEKLVESRVEAVLQPAFELACAEREVQTYSLVESIRDNRRQEDVSRSKTPADAARKAKQAAAGLEKPSPGPCKSKAR